MDIVCVDSFISDELASKKPVKKMLDPLGKEWDVSIWIKQNSNTKVFKFIQKVKTHFVYDDDINLECDFEEATIEALRDHITPHSENCLIVATKQEGQFKQDLLYDQGQFIDVFVLPSGRHYFKIYNEDVEYINREKGS